MFRKQIFVSDKYNDKLVISVGPKNVFFDAIVDECGNTWRISKEELKDLIK